MGNHLLKNPRTTRTAFACAFLCTALAADALAQAIPSTVDPSHIQKTLSAPSGLTAPAETSVPVQNNIPQTKLPAELTKKSFVLTAVDISGATVYTPDELKKVYAPYLGKKISVADIQAIAQAVTAKYRSDDYILSQAVVPPQGVKDGHIKLQVFEGYISNVSFEGDTSFSGSRNLLANYAEKIKAERPLKLATLERFLLHMNDLPGFTAKGLVRPSTQVGAADLVVTVTQKHLEGSYSIDNRGTRFVGPWQHTLTGIENSVFGLYERTLLRYTTVSPIEELRFIEVQHEEQIGNQGTRLILDTSDSDSSPRGTLKPLDIEGNARFYQIKVVQPFMRSRKENINGRVVFDMHNSDTDVLGINLTEDRTRAARIGGSYDFADRYFGVDLFDAQVSQGLDMFGATSQKGTRRSIANGDETFTKINVDATRVQNLPRGFSVFTAATGQYAFDPLLASEQFILGGPGFGTAYDSAELSGDSGLAGKIEARYGQPSEGPYLQSYQVFGYYDIGSVWLKDLAPGLEDKHSLASAGAGVRTNFTEHFYGSIEADWPLTRPPGDNPTDRHNPRLYVSFTGRF